MARSLKSAVVIPLFNGGRWIERTLAAVAAQTRRPDEVIVVDDGSTDDSVRRVASRADVRLLSHSGRGARSSRNVGLRAASSDLIAFLDQDDIWHPTHLEHVVGMLEAHPAAAVAASGSVTFGSPESPVWPMPVTPELRQTDPWTAFPFGTIRCPSQAVVRRNAVTAVGGWNPDTAHVADIELWLRIAAHGDVLLSDAETVAVRVHDDSYSRSLRTARIVEYLRSLAVMTHALAAERRLERPDQAGLLARRCDIAERFLAIGQHLVARDSAGLNDSVTALLERMEGEPPYFRSDVMQTLFWFLSPPRPSPRTKQLLASLHEAWPIGSVDLRSDLWGHMKDWPLSFFVRHAASRPWRRSRLMLLRHVVRARTSAPEPAITYRGVDPDGWARQRSAVRVPRRRGQHGVRMRIELPGWSGADAHDLRIAVEGRPAEEARLPSGHYDVMIPWRGHAADLAIALGGPLSFRLPDEERIRSFRITHVQYDDQRPADRLRIEPR